MPRRPQKHTETGGVSCGICETSLQQATFGFGVADVAHGIVGVTVILSMILKKEVDEKFPQYRPVENRETGYTKFIRGVPFWLLYFLFAGFMVQITLGMLVLLGGTFRNSVLCSLWLIGTILASPVTPITYCLLGLGRLYEWITVAEFVWKMDEEERDLKEGLRMGDELIGQVWMLDNFTGPRLQQQDEMKKSKLK